VHTIGRTENLLAASAVALAERVRDAAEEATGLGAGAPAAVVSLSSWLEGQSVNALALVLGMSHAGTVRLVDRLQAEGLVERRRDARDGREVQLVATPAGHEAARRVRAAREAAMAEVLTGLSATEQEALVPLLERLLASMTVDRHAARHICRLCDIDACGHPDTCPVTQAGHH
jgi:MarR family transcriptional regulator, negative regulator of the multidrug operon emrRAB